MIEKEKLRLLGIYVIVILMVLRFFVVPYSHSLQSKKELLESLVETYQSNTQRISNLENQKKVQQEETLLQIQLDKDFYPKSMPYTIIQVNLLKKLIEKAAKNKLDFVNFELPEVNTGKNVSQIKVVLRLNGEPKDFVNFLGSLNKLNKKTDITSLQITKAMQNKFLYTITFAVYRIEL
jgi:Tfp pilus assembly protein PilO